MHSYACPLDAALTRAHLALFAETQATRAFRGEEFAVQLSAQDTASGPVLRVVCERLRDNELWSADFAATCACAWRSLHLWSALPTSIC